MIDLTKDLFAPNDNPIDLSALVYEHEWSVYESLIESAAWQNLRFCLGGGLAFSSYSKHQRGMKDVDLFVSEDDKDAFIYLLNSVGYEDYYDQKPYDRTWIYRGYRDKNVLDIIWELPNHRVKVEDDWFTRGRLASVYGHRFRLIPPEDMIRSKVYVLQQDRCDWSDLLNILEHTGSKLDWEYLLSKSAPDERLIGGLLSVFAWMCPVEARKFPEWVWERMGLTQPTEDQPSEDRAALLDSREWFGPGFTEARELKA